MKDGIVPHFSLREAVLFSDKQELRDERARKH